MTGFGKRGVEQRPVVEHMSPRRNESQVQQDDRTLNFMIGLKRYTRWAGVTCILLVCAFGLLMMIAPFDALQFALEHPIVQKLANAGLLALGPLVVVLAVLGNVAHYYLANRRHNEQSSSGKNRWPLYGLCAGLGLLVFLIFSSESPLGLFPSNKAPGTNDPLLMTLAGYVGLGLVVARVLDHFGIGLTHE